MADKKAKIPAEKQLSPVAEGLGKTTEELAVEIAKISRGMEVLQASRLKFSTIVKLIGSASGVAQVTVEKVLFAMQDLEKIYLK